MTTLKRLLFEHLVAQGKPFAVGIAHRMPGLSVPGEPVFPGLLEYAPVFGDEFLRVTYEDDGVRASLPFPKLGGTFPTFVPWDAIETIVCPGGTFQAVWRVPPPRIVS